MEYMARKLIDMTRAGAPAGYLQDAVEELMQKQRAAVASKYINPMMMYSPDFGPITATTARWSSEPSPDLNALVQAQAQIKEMTEILERIKEEPLILYKIDRLSKDNKHAYVKKGDIDLRIKAVDKLTAGDEVLLHPKSFQIVEHLGRPPLEVSRFAPDKIPNVTWAEIGGLEEAKLDLREAIELPHSHAKLYSFYKHTPIKGILLSGPPGCGKTMLGKAAATTLSKIHKKESVRTGFLYIKGPEILDKYVGQTEQTIRDLFYDAKRHKEQHGYPAIIFIDEADAILSTRGNSGFNLSNTIVPAFLTEMDGLEESTAIVIIATNRPDVLDPAIVRDGRIDRKVEVTRPKEKEAAVILRLNLEKSRLAGGTNLDELVTKTTRLIFASKLHDILSGAMLANCVHLATSFAIRRDIESGTQSGIGEHQIEQAVARLVQSAEKVQHDLNRPQFVPIPVIVPVGSPYQEEDLDGEEPVTKH